MLRLFAALTATLFASVVLAQAPTVSRLPASTMRLVVPWPAGGNTDLIGRLVGQNLAANLGTSVIVDNRPGANGGIGAEQVAKAAPDGNTLLVSSMGTHTMNQFFEKLNYDPVADVTPISLLVNVPSLIVAHPSVAAGDTRALVALAKANPGRYDIASGSSALQLAVELFKMQAGIDLVQVRYRGSSQVLTDVVGGHIKLAITGIPAITPHLVAGKLKAIGVTTSRRATALPDVPTIGESIPGYEFDNWTGIVTSGGTPKPIIAKLNAEVVRILNTPAVREKFLAMGAEPTPSTPEAFEAVLKRDADRWGKLIKATGIKPD